MNNLNHLPLLQKDIEKFISSSGCKSFKFLPLKSTTGGISAPDYCIISSNLDYLPLNIYLYIILHEIAHQFQYKKYGKDVALSVYDSTPISESLDKLLFLESQADRLAIFKLKQLNKKHNLNLEIPPYRYLGMKDTSKLKRYIEETKKEVSSAKLTDIESINNYILKKYLLNI
jgi:hypothetical protein